MTDTATAVADLDVPELLSAIVPLTHVDVRDPSGNGDGTWTMSGYAAVFNQQAVYLDSKWLRIILEIDPAAFDGVLQTQGLQSASGVVHFNLGHDMNRAVAATNVAAGQPGSLQLSSDAHGLRYFAKVSKDDPDGVALATKMRDGVIAQASMAFVCARDEITETMTEDGPDIMLRRILEVGALYDVCACPQGVFSQTVSQLQQFAAGYHGHGDAFASQGHPRQPADGGGASLVNSEASEGGVARRNEELARMHRELADLRR
jgi:HK97 family phage prohead protease